MISSELGKEAIKKELPLIPKLPGVYRMLNSKNEDSSFTIIEKNYVSSKVKYGWHIKNDEAYNDLDLTIHFFCRDQALF